MEFGHDGYLDIGVVVGGGGGSAPTGLKHHPGVSGVVSAGGCGSVGHSMPAHSMAYVAQINGAHHIGSLRHEMKETDVIVELSFPDSICVIPSDLACFRDSEKNWWRSVHSQETPFKFVRISKTEAYFSYTKPKINLSSGDRITFNFPYSGPLPEKSEAQLEWERNSPDLKYINIPNVTYTPKPTIDETWLVDVKESESKKEMEVDEITLRVRSALIKSGYMSPVYAENIANGAGDDWEAAAVARQALKDLDIPVEQLSVKKKKFSLEGRNVVYIDVSNKRFHDIEGMRLMNGFLERLKLWWISKFGTPEQRWNLKIGKLPAPKEDEGYGGFR